eukprot:CAMPEP_0196824952 /NCGR_PEP_ID=MMETSP1362-20130617/92778_1 /TAXON_ID=163516 /ORGANISM="Leptocylindrus danicus, Strain CCMP1856" /LENGTH=529 /DNA_ID=CAMNT_0042205315 /DNA_START=505 /DNA_END=2094 /DNA_ORIENTATION=-
MTNIACHYPSTAPREFTAASMVANEKIPAVFRHEKNPEATGYGLIAFTNSMITSAAIFYTTSLLDLARVEAGCLDEEEECDALVYGILKPTSLLTMMATIAGAGASVLMPLVGSIVDHSNYRRSVGKYAAVLLTAISAVCIFLSQTTFPFFVILYIFLGFTFLVHNCVACAYVADLTKDHKEMARYMARFSITQYLSFMFGIIVTSGIAMGIGTEDIGAARVAQGLSSIICIIFLGTAWTFLLQEREALSEVPEGSTIISAGFKSLYRTMNEIRSKFPALKWFLLVVCFAEAATGAIIVVSTTYMESVLGMSSTEIGAVFLTVLVAAIPGSLIAKAMTTRYNPFRSIQAVLLLWIVSIPVGASILTGRENWGYIFAMGIFWGIGLGWLHPTNMTAFISIIPPGRESELMGTIIFAGTCLNWFPSLMFTVLNEAGMSMRWGLATLDVFFVLAFFVLFLVGSYEKAVKQSRALLPSPASSPHCSYHDERHGGAVSDVYSDHDASACIAESKALAMTSIVACEPCSGDEINF